MPSKEKKNFLALNYDKLILAAATVILAASVAFLYVRSQAREGDIVKFKAQIKAPAPEARPRTPVVNNAEFERTIKVNESPLALNTNNVALVAPKRMICISDSCRKIIDATLDVCPICGAQQPTGVPPEDFESMNPPEGIPDVWRIANGFSIYEIIGDLDADGDGFSNKDEYLAATDPQDAKNHPSYFDYMRVEKIEKMPFKFELKNKSKGANDNYTFYISDLSGRPYSIRTNQLVKGVEPWTAVSYTLFEKTEFNPATQRERKLELARLTLSDGKEEVVLEERAGLLYNTFVVTLVCLKQPDNEPIVVRQREEFIFDGKRYTGITVPADNSQFVTVTDDSTKEKIRIPPIGLPASDLPQRK